MKTRVVCLGIVVLVVSLSGARVVLATAAVGQPRYSLTPERPVFLAWPLPQEIGVSRISMYPNTPWTWHYLGLRPGYQCPPAFGYLDDVSSWAYWRDPSIPNAQDRAQADPHDFKMVACYATDSFASTNGHEGTDIKAPAGTAVYAAASGKVYDWRLFGLYTMIVLKHCLGGHWNADSRCIGGVQWYTTYMHVNLPAGLQELNKDIHQGDQIATVYEQTINSHLHFEVGLDRREYGNYVNPWGSDRQPWDGCMWLDRGRCPLPDPDFARTGALNSYGYLFVKETPGFAWVNIAHDVRMFRISGSRIAILDRQGRVFVKEGALHSRWARVASGVRTFDLLENRIAIVDQNGGLFVKNGSLYEDWLPPARYIDAFSPSADWISIWDRLPAPGVAGSGH